MIRCLECNAEIKGESIEFCPKCKKKLTHYFKYKIDHSSENGIKPIKYQINKYLNLRLENNRTNIYIGDKYFRQCHYTLLGLRKQNKSLEERQKDFICIDEAIDNLERVEETLSPYQEFIAQTSNFEAWAENDYNTNILTYQLSFPLLRELAKKGDIVAKRRYKEEIINRINSGYLPVIIYLLNEDYLEVFSEEEIETLLQELKEIDNIFIHLLIEKREIFKRYNHLMLSKKNALSCHTFAIKSSKKNKSITHFDNWKRILSFKDRNQIPRIRYKKYGNVYYDFNSFFSSFSSEEQNLGKSNYRNLLQYKTFWDIVNILDKKEDIMIYVPKGDGIFKFSSKEAGLEIIVRPTILSYQKLKRELNHYKQELRKKRKERKQKRKNERKLKRIITELKEKAEKTNFYIDKFSFLSKWMDSIRIVIRNKEDADLMNKEDFEDIALLESALKGQNLSISIVNYINGKTMSVTSLYYLKIKND